MKSNREEWGGLTRLYRLLILPLLALLTLAFLPSLDPLYVPPDDVQFARDKFSFQPFHPENPTALASGGAVRRSALPAA